MKITKEFLEAQIAKRHFIMATETKTICIITTPSGFTFLGEADCVSPANFNQDIGREIAFQDAFAKMWMPYGFALAQRLYEAKLGV